MNIFAKLRLTVLGYMILAGVVGTIGTAGFQLYQGPSSPIVVLSQAEQVKG